MKLFWGFQPNARQTTTRHLNNKQLNVTVSGDFNPDAKPTTTRHLNKKQQNVTVLGIST